MKVLCISDVNILRLFISHGSNHLLKFVPRSDNNTRCVIQQQLWLTNVVRTLPKKSGYSCFCLEKRPNKFVVTRYRSKVENLENKYCYSNSGMSDKLLNTFVSKRTDDSDQIEYIEKQVSENEQQ